MKKRISKGLITIYCGLAGIILTILINKYVDIHDIFVIIMMIISLLIEIYGLIQIIKDKTYY